MKPWVRDLVGVLSHLPGAYLLYFFGSFIWMLAQITRAKGAGAHLPPQGSLFLAHIIIILLLLVFYMMWLMIGSGFTLEVRILWAIGLVFGAPVTLPVLYWIYLHRLAPGPYYFGRPFQGWPWRRP